MAGISELDSLDSAKYIFLRGLSEPRANSLHLVVQEAVVSPLVYLRSTQNFPGWPKS